MIKSILSGGLGNQMFQYAATRALAIKHNVDCKLDISVFDRPDRTSTSRSYELEHFILQENHSEPISSLWSGIYFSRVIPFIKKQTGNTSLIRKMGIFSDQIAFNFDPNFLSLPAKVTLYGYFQTEKYFSSISDIIRKEFTFKRPLSKENKNIAEKIKNTTSISLHVRRGDYFSNQAARYNFATCTPEYYNRAISLIKEKVKQPSFFLFSDDPEWTKKNIRVDTGIYIDWNTQVNSYIDMQLMSLCKHHIIANSSFSWWGAWLGENPEKIVIAPSRWFRNSEKNNLVKDLIPEKWIKI